MSPTTALASPFEVAARVRVGAEQLQPLSDQQLLALARSVAAARHAIDAAAARIAGEVARRSATPDGLAQRLGHRTAIELVKVTTGTTGRDAATSVRVGTMPASVVTEAVFEGAISPAAGDAIATGLGAPTASVDADRLAEAATALIAADLDPDRLLREAREVRAHLDLASVTDREAALRSARALRVRSLPGGMSRLIWDMDPETAATVTELYDRTTSPRRGGVRFVDPTSAAQATRIADDERTTEQLASDVFAELLRQGAAADSSQLLATGAPQVRVQVALETLQTGVGLARIEGQTTPVSAATAARLACTGGTTEVTFHNGQPLDVGREQRLYTARQRVALAARDGGCRWPGCDRPPSWTEAHHIHHWARDGGRTDVADGVLLCRHHHLLLHNHDWTITRSGDRYTLHPPAGHPAPGPQDMPARPGIRAA